MLDSFVAHNFRQFTNLSIPKLAQVNLFVGRNNVGKSALLEALQIYLSQASGDVLADILIGRAENWDSIVRSNDAPSMGDSIRHLFRGHQLPSIGEKGIIVGPSEIHRQLQLTIAAYQSILNSDSGTRQLLLLDVDQTNFFGDSTSDSIPYLVAVENNRTRRLGAIHSTIRRLQIQPATTGEVVNLRLVPTKGLPPRTVAAWWDAINLTDLEEEVVAGLRVINDMITGIAFVEGSSSRASRIPLVRVQGQAERLPLSSMGDGVTRLLYITLALVNAKDGVLLIDEFENGLHWSVQEKVWQTVFQLASRLNVQVFATTHSRDCVQSFEAAWRQHPTKGVYYRLESDPIGEVRARSYSLETLSDSIETDTETR